MAEIITKITVADKAEAVSIMEKLINKYQLILTDPENMLDASNDKFHAFYDSDKSAVIVETNDAGSIEEYIKELIAEFPPLF